MAVDEKGRRVLKAKGQKRSFTCIWAGVEPTEEELDKILADHEFWLESFGYAVFKKPKEDPPHNLSQIRLTEFDMKGINLQWAVFSRADLNGSDFSEAELMGADLTDASLMRANFTKAKLVNATLNGSSLQYADFTGANLGEAKFIGATLIEVTLTSANLWNADLRKAKLWKNDLTGASLFNADLRRSHLNLVCMEKTDTTFVKYNRWGRYLGIRLEGCFGSPRFVRFAKDQEFIEEFRSKKWRFWLLYLPWLIFSDCGRSFLLWAAWSMAFAFAFATIYFFGFGESAFNYTKELGWSFGTTLYYSIVTFTTLGFGDITPKSGWAAFWITLEVILGYVMLGGLISIFATKLARRS